MKFKSISHDISLSFAIGFAFCFLLSCELAINPFTLYSGYDSCIFEQMGLGIIKGYTPYVDLFDHKGFLLYLINASGLWMFSGHAGLYILLSLSLSATYLCWLRMADYLVSPSLRHIPALLALLFALIFEGGNMTETWSLFWISLPIYYLVRYLTRRQIISLPECFCIGVCISMAANLRLNNIVPAFTVCLYMFIDLCFRRAFRQLTYSILAVLGGFFVVTMALVGLYIALYGMQHLDAYWFACIGFNLCYIDQFRHETLWQASGFYFPLLTLLVMLCQPHNHRNRLVWFTFCSFLLTLLTTGTAYFAHYFTLFAPHIVLTISLSLTRTYSISLHVWRLAGIGLLALLAGLVAVFHSDIQQKIEDYCSREQAIRECASCLSSLLPQQKSSVWNYNTMMKGANILTRAGIVQCNRIFLQYQVEGSYGVEEIGTIEEIRPEVILVDEHTRWGGGIRTDALESFGTTKDSIFIAKDYRRYYQSETLGVCIYVKR